MSEYSKLPTAVIGIGYLGKYHAEKYKELESSELIGVVDLDEKHGKALADQLGVPFYNDYREIIDRVKAVSIVVPTVSHYRIAKEFLEHDVHVLVEKPIASHVHEAKELVEIAAKRNRILHVGHLQRFDSAMLEARKLIKDPIFLEIHRMSAFPNRSTDIDVVLDLMIHDIDLALSLVKQPVKEIRASGVPVISGSVDIASSRVEFMNGAVANFTASRVSLTSMRKFRVFEKDAYYSIDLQKGALEKAIRVKDGDKWTVDYGRDEFGLKDALMDEVKEFLKQVNTLESTGSNLTNDSIIAEGEEALKALEVAEQIRTKIEENLKNFTGDLNA